MPPALGDFDTAYDDATPGQMASSLPERPAGLWLTRSSGAGDGCDRIRRRLVMVYCGLICPRISPRGLASV